MSKFSGTKGRRDRVYTVFQLPDHQRSKGHFRGGRTRDNRPKGARNVFENFGR